MASSSVRDPEYVNFEESVNTLRYRHAVIFSGQKLLYQVMISLTENPRKIKETIQATLGTKSSFKNCFTKSEKQELNSLPSRKWNLSLLFKIIQKICGLKPEGDPSWNPKINGNTTLECMLTQFKNWRNTLAHNLYEVIADDQLPGRLDELATLSDKVISALKETLKLRSKPIPTAELSKVAREIKNVVMEVKKMKVIIITPNNNDSDDDMHDSSTTSIRPAQTPHVTSLEDLFRVLVADFWQLAGHDEFEI